MGDYLTIAEYRNFTNLQSDEYSDAQLTIIINSVEDWFNEKVLGYTLYDYGSVTEVRNGNGSNIIFTDRFPIQSVTSVKIDDNDNGTKTLISSDDYNVDLKIGKITINTDSSIPLFYAPGSKKYNVELVYVAGVSSVPDFIKVIIQRMITNILNKDEISTGVENDISRLSDNGMRMSLL